MVNIVLKWYIYYPQTLVYRWNNDEMLQGKGLFVFLHGRSGKVMTTSRGVATPTKPMPPLTLQGRETGSIRTVS